MFIYNITIKVDNEIVQQWLQWQREVHMPETMATKLFNDSKVFKLLEYDNDGSTTYVMQYFTDTKENYNRYINEYVSILEKKALEKWGNNFIVFRTLMQSVH